ncbi:MAG: hypothetical protein JO306_01380 [Gemmatimonadetes bacterium]|nr:hypothetical protein [Gemmatimonadota bacterium]
MVPRLSLAAAACAVAALLCVRPAAAQADSAATTAQPTPAPKPRVHHDRNALSEDEIEQRHDANAYELVRALRPGWLRGNRGDTGLNADPVAVIRDGMPMGSLGALRDLSLESVKEMHFYDGMEATQRWGTGHSAGAIVVTTK